MLGTEGGNLAVTVGLGIFFLELLLVLISDPSIFFRRYAINHRILGLTYLTWLLVGLVARAGITIVPEFMYDVTLCCLGVALTLTAAFDFRKGHEHVRNIASGALDDKATVTFSEMIEHSFYQGLNVLQIVFLHLGPRLPTVPRALLALAVTSPWIWRHRFPINKFSDNYTKHGTTPTSLIGILYRLKKYQYMLYKHFLLHGLTATVAASSFPIASDPAFRLYWLALNTAYVMEFFLQTLVRRRRISQTRMLRMNQFLMVVSSVVAVQVLARVAIVPALLSLALNFANRGKDFVNFAIVLCVALR
eukprot:c854_g1_i1.p1 GENE.c854_g1_i1~~c854_g1_i1.p1  ORF type:complete len:305 (+),score=56.41 c854_g1_i1:32-946(+)